MTTLAERHGWTFQRLLVRPSRPTDNCKQCGQVHPYWTQNHIPAIFPDQWAEGKVPLEGLIEAPADLDLSEFVPYGSNEEVPKSEP